MTVIYTAEEYRALEKENKKLKELIKKLREVNRENCSLLDGFSEKNRELEEENKKLEHKNELQEKALIKLCLKNHYDSIIIEGEEVIDMSNYKVVDKIVPKNVSLFS